MKHDRIAMCAAAVVATALVGACTATTSGAGYAVKDAVSPTSPAATTPPAPSTAVPSTPAGSGVPAPSSCPGGTCHQQLSASLSSPYVLIIRTNTAFGSTGATIVELTKSNVPVYWYTIPEESPAQLNCSTTNDSANCVLVDHAGAHGSNATVWRLDSGSLVKGNTVTSDSPDMQGRDLNSDGLVDAETMQNTFQPNYASGAVYWQTWTSDGSRLTSTGCTTASHNPPSAPTSPVTGNCP